MVKKKSEAVGERKSYRSERRASAEAWHGRVCAVCREKGPAGERSEEISNGSFVGTLISKRRTFWPMLHSLQRQRCVPDFLLKARSMPSSLASYAPLAPVVCCVRAEALLVSCCEPRGFGVQKKRGEPLFSFRVPVSMD